MNLNFFKKKNKKIKDLPLTERELLISSIGIEKLRKVCNNLFIDIEKISFYLLNVLSDNPDFLQYVSNNYLSSDLVNKINNGPIKLQDIGVEDFELFKFPIFDNSEKEKIAILQRELLISNIKKNKYFSVNSDDFKTSIVPDSEVVKKVRSYFDDVEIETKKQIVSINNSLSYGSKGITYLFTNDSAKYNFKDGYYFDKNINFDTDTIVIMNYEKFINLSDDEIKILSNYNLVIRDDYTKLSQLYNSISMNDMYIEETDEIDYNRIMVNHLLFCVRNSDLSEDRKKYYSYYISNHYLKDKRYYIYDYANKLENEIGIDKINDLTKGFNNLPLDDKLAIVKEEKFDFSIFIHDGNDIDKMSSFSLLYEICNLNDIERNIVLENSLIREKLRVGLLEESKDDQYYYYGKILSFLSVSEFLSLYDKDFLKRFFGTGYSNGSKYKFFVSLCQKDFNATINYILNDDGLFDEFFSVSDYFYSMFYSFDYELLLKCILKIENGNREYKNDFASSIPEEYQRRLLGEELKDSTIVWLLPVFKPEVISEFLEKDPRALYLFSKFNIKSFINDDKPIRFNREILMKDEFFDLLKSDSFVSFRANINNAEKHNDPMIIEEKRKKYSRELINSYQTREGMFKIYADILDVPSKVRETNNYDPYIFNDDIYSILCGRLRESDDGNYYFEEKERLISLLKKETSLRLSEIIVDDLFEDNIYNVWLNIKEMIRYNDNLKDGQKVLEPDKLELYNVILNIDSIDSEEKIKLYNSLKDKNYNLIFYEDLRRLKDIAYDEIKSSMFSSDIHDVYISRDISDKYGTTIYDLSDKKFTMLVRRMSSFYEESNYGRGCYSIISDENTDVFHDDIETVFTYGYNSFENDVVVHMFERDAYSADTKDNSSRYVNRIMGPKEIVNAHRWYSEVQILNEKNDEKQGYYTAKKPDFIVVFDEINNMAVSESKRLNIPVVMVKSQKLRDENMINISFDSDYDVYMKYSYKEEKRRTSRL